jgi:hypothetical protein
LTQIRVRKNPRCEQTSPPAATVTSLVTKSKIVGPEEVGKKGKALGPVEDASQTRRGETKETTLS